MGHRDDQPTAKVRLDRWLWAARFFKTRRLAVEAIKGGKVEVDGVNAKPAREVGAGNRVRVRKGAITFEVVVRDVANQRGPAKVAQQLYEETPESVAAREKVREQQRMNAAFVPRPDHRPDKRSRRQLARVKRGGGE
ncbi:RNA-binding S4 domain-containing protein [Alkalilimnicola ehrlichii MLHE-1]|uniref:Heat shock protein 15 n=1 Tax=Alkalilimnicola ehrlichii (strain ATCC BAA-1101 / DSM 17681 / MLHE-1) TaxID=187272 RepID=Q0A9G5_ALKEH|nr:S4 domain-containing protein [Alkalilimnicola ehrlichii]ABI56522.1 heat shock protein Hsp15 [Alkalilimnicola ehrlichii MLHE-1]